MNKYEKEFMSLFEKLCTTRSAWQVWSDFVTASAISISNIIDEANSKQREAEYMNIISRYADKNESELISKLLAVTASALDEDPEQDFLGKMFMKLELGSHQHGQFFTPYHISSLMAATTEEQITRTIEENGYVTMNEPACGAGANIIAARAEVVKAGYDPGMNMFVVAQDIDRTSAMMCYIQLSLLGVSGYIVIGDTLRYPVTGGTLSPNFTDEQEEWLLPATVINQEWNIRILIERLRLWQKESA